MIPVMVKYHPIPLSALKKMMRSNAASLMAGGGAVYLKFDNGSTQNIIKSLISSAGAFTNLVWCSPYERWVDFQSSFPGLIASTLYDLQ